jgi:hypothetical protein
MANAIETVEGIGKTYAEKLKAAGIKTTDQYLERAKDRSGRLKLAEELGFNEALILK